MRARRFAPLTLVSLCACASAPPSTGSFARGENAAKARSFAIAVPLASAHARTPPAAPREPLAPPVDAAESKPAHVATVSNAAGDEPLAPPVDTVFKVAGIGLSGVGEGGGGRGEGIGLGGIGTIGRGAGGVAAKGHMEGVAVGDSFGASGASVGSEAGYGSGHGRLAGSHKTSVTTYASSGYGAGGGNGLVPSSVQAGEWDDNANFREFTRWLAKEHAPGAARLDLSVRRFLVVKDAAGHAVPSCEIAIADGVNASEALRLRTTSTGRALLFPRAEGLVRSTLTATARCEGQSVTRTISLDSPDAAVEFALGGPRSVVDRPTIDIAFVVDTTGSMSEEIDALRDTLEHVASSLGSLGITPRVGLVEYKDRGDEYVTRLHQMTTDCNGLAGRITSLRAEGGGDTPEHVNEAVRVAVRQLKFRPESLARLVFLVGDAPPHLDYAGDEGYVGAMKEANHAGIQLDTIAASGMDTVGQVVWRQLAQYTAGTNLFVLRGGAGPQSTGGGDPRSSCGGTHADYTSGNLDALVLGRIREAIAARDADPMRIAGLGKDERDRPCDQRVVARQ